MLSRGRRAMKTAAGPARRSIKRHAWSFVVPLVLACSSADPRSGQNPAHDAGRDVSAGSDSGNITPANDSGAITPTGDGANCVNLQCQQQKCADGGSTT